MDEIGFVTAFHRKGIDGFEPAMIVIRLREAGVSNQDVAKKLGIAAGYRLEDQTGTRKFFCLSCVSALLRACLTPLRGVAIEP